MPKKNTNSTALATPNMDVLVLPPGVELLPDNKQYTNRFNFVSASGTMYRAAQSKSGRWWSCSCPSWIHKAEGNRHCKHLRDFGLPADYEKFEVGRLEVSASATAPIGAVPMPTSKKGKAKLAALSGGKAPTAVSAAPEAPALPAAPAPTLGCKPKSVEMAKGGDIVVTFDAKDSAAVFALLAKLSEGAG